MRFFVIILVMSLRATYACADFTPTNPPRSYILMDWDTGTVMAQYNENNPYPIASVTKVMTMLLCMEAIEENRMSFEDVVTASDYACSMGGSQIYLEPGEQMSVKDLIKSVAVASANDSCVALAEHLYGSTDSFVEAMNQRAKALGMKNTHFVNCNGLDADNHYSSAMDVAIMSRELLKYDKIRPFLSIWMDSVRNGAFGLSNTNKLIRFYPGAIGVKTGSTTNAKYCLSAGATKNDLTLLAVVLGAETTDQRFQTAKELLNYGFANYEIKTIVNKNENMGTVEIKKGKVPQVDIVPEKDFKLLFGKNENKKPKIILNILEDVSAPIFKGQVLGTAEILDNTNKITINLVATEDIERIELVDVFLDLLKKWTFK